MGTNIEIQDELMQRAMRSTWVVETALRIHWPSETFRIKCSG
jgi:Arc/MetJ family transcription regulator